jgi:hypothetical protein
MDSHEDKIWLTDFEMQPSSRNLILQKCAIKSSQEEEEDRRKYFTQGCYCKP